MHNTILIWQLRTISLHYYKLRKMEVGKYIIILYFIVTATASTVAGKIATTLKSKFSNFPFYFISISLNCIYLHELIFFYNFGYLKLFLWCKAWQRWIHFATRCVQMNLEMPNVWDYALIESSILDRAFANLMALTFSVAANDSDGTSSLYTSFSNFIFYLIESNSSVLMWQRWGRWAFMLSRICSWIFKYFYISCWWLGK